MNREAESQEQIKMFACHQEWLVKEYLRLKELRPTVTIARKLAEIARRANQANREISRFMDQ